MILPNQPQQFNKQQRKKRINPMIKMMNRITSTAMLAVAFMLCASSAWAVVPTPTVVWDGDFSTTVSKTGTDGNSYVFSSLNGLSVNGDGNLVINTANAQGALIELPDTSKTAATVVIKYSNLAAETTGNATLANFQVFSGDNKYYIGSRSIGKGTLNLSAYCESPWYYFNAATYGNGSVPQVPTGSGYYVFAYDSSVGTYTYTGTSLYSLSGGYNTQLKWGSYKIGQVYIGGGQNNSMAYCWKGSGTVIEKVAIFMGAAYTADDLAEYAFPTAGKYANWEYAKDVFTWTSASTADMSSSSATYYLFDRSSGTDTATEYNGGSTAYTGGGNFWRYWTMRQPNYYSAPGFVLRLISGKQSTIGGSFAPLTLGGMIVEEGATGYNFYHGQGSDAESVYGDGKSHRTTIFGDCTGETETWFKFEESISFNRPGRNRLSGTVNFYIASGKTVSINTDTTAAGYSADFDPAIYQTVNETGKNAATLSAGGTLKMHGEGTIAVNTLTANDSVLDYSDLGNRLNTNPFVSGTLAINEGTKFILPEGATSPYKVATAISGTYPTSITIGDKTYAAVISAGANAGEIAWEINETTIDAAGDDYVLSTIFPDPASTKDYTVFVKADATLDIGSAEVRSIMFDVAEGKTLTLSGTSLSATTIYVTGKGVVKATANNALSGTVKGDGTLLYQYGSTASDAIPTGLTLTDSAWTGTLWLKNMGSTSTGTGSAKTGICLGATSGTAAANPASLLGNSGSKVKFTNVRAHVYTVSCPWTLVLEDDGDNYAWYDNNGWAAQTATFAALAGDGTLFDEYTGNDDKCSQQLIFTDASAFTGHIAANGKRIGFGGSTTAASGNAGIIHVNSGNLTATPTFKANKYYVASGATLNFAGGTIATEFVSIVGTININSDATLTVTSASQDTLNYGGTGTVNVRGTLAMTNCRWTIGSSNVINLYEDGTISGAGQSTYGALDWYQPGTLNVYGTSTISANIRCRDSGNLSFNVDSGVCTFSGESYGTMPITKTGSGTLKIAYAGSSSYNLPSVSEGTIEFASGTWNLGAIRSLAGYTMTDGGTAIVKVAQTAEEYAKGIDVTVSNIDSSIGEITVVPAAGSEETLTVSGTSATYSGSGTTTVGGKACTFDWEFNGNLNSVGYNTTSLSGSSAFDAGNQELYVRSSPYYNGSWTWADNWTVAIKSTMPARGKDIVIAFGTKTGGIVALITSPNAGKVKLVRTTSDVAATDISEMAVADRAGAQHLYLFSKTSDGRMRVYCDDTLIDDKEVSEISSLPGTLQVGSIHGSKGSSGLTSPESTDNAAIDFLQVYNYEINDAMRNKIISEYAWVNPNKYSRIVDGDEDLSSADTWTKLADSSTAALPATDADALIVASSASAALTINANFEADTITINSGDEGAALRIKAGTGTLSAAKVVVNAPVTVEYGAVDFSGSVVTFGEGGSLTYDFSGVAINSLTTRLVEKLTGLVEAPADPDDPTTWPVQVITHSDAASLADCYESTFSYDPDDSAYHYVCGPDHNWGSEVYYTGGYWSSDSGNTISVTNAAGATTKVFAGDTVVIPSYYPNDTTWSDNTLPANVTKIRVSKSKIKVCSGANSGDIFTGVTWTVDSGCVLWFGVDSKTTSLGAMTINGTGSVECGNITINGAMSGNAPVSILDNVTTRLTATGSIATAHTISGGSTATIAVAKTTPISERMSFGTWTGTVTLPENFNANSDGIDFHYYGKSGSTIEINGFTGWLKTVETYSGAGTYGRQVNPHLKLNGNMSITGLSAAWYDIIGGISGSGNFSLSSSNKPNDDSFWISKVSDYTGSIVNNTTGSAETTIVIKELVADSFVGGAKLLSRGGVGPLSIGKVTVDETEQSISDLCYESDGVYVAAAEYDSVKYYSVAAAIAEAGDANLANITVLNGCKTAPDGYLISGGNVAKAQAAVVDTDGVAHYYATAQDAVDHIAYYYVSPQYNYFAVYSGENVAINLNMATWQYLTFKIKCFNSSSVVVTPNSAEYEFVAGEPDVNGVVTYTKTEKATTYVWVGTGDSALAWGNNNKWKVGTSDGDDASRAPGANDTVIINGGAPISISGVTVTAMHIGGEAAISGSGTLTATTGGITLTDSAATLTVTGVTLSPAPTTNVSRSRVVERTTGTYSVELIPGTIFSVY